MTTRTQRLSSLVILFFALFLSGISANDRPSRTAPEQYMVVRGERPPIDKNTISPEATESGVLLIKFKEAIGNLLDAQPPTTDKDGQVRFNMEGIDSANALFGLQRAGHYFFDPALKTSFSDRHRAWGFHLWYKFEFDQQTDINTLLDTYKSLPEVDVVEPLFRKRPVLSEVDATFDIGFSTTQTDKTWTPNDPLFALQWHYRNTGQDDGLPGADIDLGEAWQHETGHNELIVAVIDSGVDHNHPDLAANMWEGIGYNFVHDTEAIVPGDHGTHVAGTIAAVTGNGIGVAGIAGGSGSGNGVRIMSVMVHTGGDIPGEEYQEFGHHLALIWAADHGAAISQNSWLYSEPFVYNQAVLDAIDYFNTHGGGSAMPSGGLTIFGAGNNDASSHYYPAYYSGTLAVAATNNRDERPNYSNFGHWVNISAPGDRVYSTMKNNAYGFMSGTSMACPHVTGVAALIVSKAFGQITPGQVRDILLTSVDDHYGQNPEYIEKLGAGRLNAGKALLQTIESLTSVFNPHDFTATATAADAMLIQWGKNNHQDDVVLALFDTDTQGMPANGENYLPGDALPGGGIVLYRGGNRQFELQGLESATEYRFGIWSVNEAGTYSSGRATSCVSLGCEVSNQCSYTFRMLGRYGGYWGKQYLTVYQGGRLTATIYKGCGRTYADTLVTLCSDLPFEVYYHWELDKGHDHRFDFVALQIIDPNGRLIFEKPSGILTADTLLFEGSGDCLPVSCPLPIIKDVTETGTHHAVIEWTPRGNETLWDIECGPMGFTHGNGKFVAGIEANNYRIEGLDPGTRYDVYVRAVCEESEVSHWSLKAGFSTDCGAIELPLFNDFDSEPILGKPYCWSVAGPFEYNVNITDQSVAMSPPNSLRMEHGNDQYAMLVSPLINLNGNNIRIRFHALWGWLPSTLSIGFMNDPSDPDTFTPVASISNIDENYRHVLIEHNMYLDYPGEDFLHIAFKLACDETEYMSWIDIDDLSIEAVHSCNEPYNISLDQVTATSVSLDWVQQGNATEWDVAYGPLGFSPGTEGAVRQSTQAKPYVLDGLNPASWYQVYLRSRCSSEVSPWIFGGSFSTQSGPLPLPHNETFSEAVHPYLPGGWNAFGTGVYQAGVNLYQVAHITLVYPGPMAVLIAPEFDKHVSEISMQFRAMSWLASLEVGVITDISDPGSFQIVEMIEFPSVPGQLETYTVEFDAYPGEDGRIALRFGPYNTDKAVMLDDFLFRNIHEPLPPPQHTIHAYAADHGAIEPSGPITVDAGEELVFRIIPDHGHHLAFISINGEHIDLESDTRWDSASGAFTFRDVGQDHSIEVGFAASAQVTEQEFLALKAFYNATNGDSWYNRTGWENINTTATKYDVTSAWYGITVNTDQGHVSELSFYDNNLEGTIPPEIADLKWLTRFALYKNKLPGPLPEEIGQLTELISFDINDNQITGPLPASMANLTKLKWVNFSFNPLNCPFPNDLLQQWTQLELFSAYRSGLTGAIDDIFDKLPELRNMDISGNQLHGELPPSLSLLTKLREVHFGSNNFTGNLPDLSNSASMYYLTFLDNQFTGEIPASYGTFRFLQYFHVEDNNLSGPIPPGLFDGGLSRFHQHQNYFTFESIEPVYNKLRLLNNSYYSNKAFPLNQSAISVEAGEPITLDASALSVYALGGANNRYKWFQNDTELYSGNNPAYVIPSAGAANAGTYRFEVTNTVVPNLTIKSESIVVNVTGTNEPPSDILLSQTTVDENFTGLLAYLSASDPNEEDTHTFSRIQGDGTNDRDNYRFNISGNELHITSAADYENTPVLNILISADDGNGGIFSKAFEIQVNDINEAPVWRMASTSVTIDENVPNGTVVFSLIADDPEKDPVTYSLESGKSEQAFAIEGDKLVVANTSLLIYDEQKTHILTAIASDGELTSTIPLTVNLNKIELLTGNDLLTFSVPGLIGQSVINAGNHTIDAVVRDADLSQLVASFTISPGATAQPPSGTTFNFTTPQTIAVTSQAGTTQNWLVTVVLNVGTDDLAKNSVTIYPNPAREFIRISGIVEESSLEIYTLTGQCVLRSMIRPDSYAVEISNLKPGTYLVLLQNRDMRAIKMLVKQ